MADKKRKYPPINSPQYRAWWAQNRRKNRKPIEE